MARYATFGLVLGGNKVCGRASSYTLSLIENKVGRTLSALGVVVFTPLAVRVVVAGLTRGAGRRAWGAAASSVVNKVARGAFSYAGGLVGKKIGIFWASSAGRVVGSETCFAAGVTQATFSGGDGRVSL